MKRGHELFKTPKSHYPGMVPAKAMEKHERRPSKAAKGVRPLTKSSK